MTYFSQACVGLLPPGSLVYTGFCIYGRLNNNLKTDIIN